MIVSLLMASSLWLPQALPENLPAVYLGAASSVFKDTSEERINWGHIGLFWKTRETRSRHYGDFDWVVLSEVKLGSEVLGLTAAYGFHQRYDLGPRHRRFFMLYGIQGGASWMTRTVGATGHLLAGTINGHIGPEWKLGQKSSFFMSLQSQLHLGFISGRLAPLVDFETLASNVGFSLGARF
jgi:hypothetical protein